MRKKLLSILALTILVTLTLVGCSGESSTPSTLTILSITEGTVLVMKTGTDTWTEAQAGMSLEVGDAIKTGDDSSAEITFFDGSTVELEAGTQIEITSLASSADTGATTITLMQTIGTTISRVTKLLDPASSYAIETPSGVAAVRGSMMIVRIVFDDPTYEGGTVLMTCVEGDIWAIWNGVELHIPEGRTCIIRPGQPPELIPLNRPPVAASDSAVTDADSSITVDAPGVLSNDSDPDGDTLAVTALSTIGTVGTVTAWGPDGSFTYDPNGQFEYLPAGNSTSDSFTYTVSDDNGGTDTATVTVIINGVYDPPVYYPPVYYPPVNYPPVAGNDASTTDEDTPISVAAPGVLDNDSDPDAGDTLAVTALDTTGTVGTVTAWSADGSFTYDPNAKFEYLQAGNSTTDSFSYTVSDGHGGTDTATVTITINGVNDTPGNSPPTAGNDAATTDEDTPISVAAPGVLINDSDPDGDTLVVTAVDTSGTVGTVTAWGSDGSFAYDPNGQFESLQVGSSTTDSFTYTVFDGNGGTDTGAVTITINGLNDPPVADDDTDTTSQGTSVTIDILGNDSDPDGDTLTVNSVTQGHNGTVTNNGNDVTYTPNPGFTGVDSFSYTISDGNGGTDTATVTVTAIQTTATIRITVDMGPTAPIYVQDTTTGAMVVNGNEFASATIVVAGGHSYCVWVGGDVTRYVNSCPGWSGRDTETACGVAEAGHNYPVHFTQH